MEANLGRVTSYAFEKMATDPVPKRRLRRQETLCGSFLRSSLRSVEKRGQQQALTAMLDSRCPRIPLLPLPPRGIRGKERPTHTRLSLSRTSRAGPGRVLHRLGTSLVPWRFAFWGGMLNLGIDLAPHQQAQPGQI